MESYRAGPRFTWIQRTLCSVFRFLMCGCGQSGEDEVELSVQETMPAMQPLLNTSSVRPWY